MQCMLGSRCGASCLEEQTDVAFRGVRREPSGRTRERSHPDKPQKKNKREAKAELLLQLMRLALMLQEQQFKSSWMEILQEKKKKRKRGWRRFSGIFFAAGNVK